MWHCGLPISKSVLWFSEESISGPKISSCSKFYYICLSLSLTFPSPNEPIVVFPLSLHKPTLAFQLLLLLRQQRSILSYLFVLFIMLRLVGAAVQSFSVFIVDNYARSINLVEHLHAVLFVDMCLVPGYPDRNSFQRHCVQCYVDKEYNSSTAGICP